MERSTSSLSSSAVRRRGGGGRLEEEERRLRRRKGASLEYFNIIDIISGGETRYLCWRIGRLVLIYFFNLGVESVG